jgi:hypothetical protein
MRELSFFCEKNSREVASSKGCIAFFLVNFMAFGFLRECCLNALVLGETGLGGRAHTRSVIAS